MIASTQREQLNNFVRNRLRVRTFDATYGTIEQLPGLTAIFTTNVDNLVHRIYENSIDRYLNDIDFEGPVFRDRHAIDLVMLHGSILHDRRPLRFGTIDVASSFAADPDRWRYLQTRLNRSSTLFWGYSVEDAATLEALSATSSNARHWLLVHPSSDRADLEYYRALGFQMLIGDTQDMLAFLRDEVIPHTSHTIGAAARDSRAVFPELAVPLPGTGPTRPLVDFYRGASPMWCDIYAGLHKTAHYRSVREHIHAGRNVLISGVPACGKTTLLMQLAADVPAEGHKLIVDNLSGDKGTFLLRRLGAEEATIFIDNCTNDYEALEILSSRPAHIQVVGADRDYNLSSVMHRIDRERFAVVDITDLSNTDLQSIWTHIPESIRSTTCLHPPVTRGTLPSLLEFVEANIVEPALRFRLAHALRELRRSSPDIAEMLLFAAYVHSCRTAVSMDMIIAYWRDSNRSYEDLYTLIRDVGKMITEYEGELANEPQDYFTARSLIVAETVLDAADDWALGRMLKRFHENIGTYRICHYRIFQRQAYDSRLFGRAFPNWSEGVEFYDRLYERDPSPYLLQQMALYLNYKGEYNRAFHAIDRALRDTNFENWTIRNSHAAIMFKANIEFAGQAIARGSLDESMEILKRCYKSDRRKVFHAMTFADHAIHYWDAYGDTQAREYLNQALTWLVEQKRKEPWLRRIVALERAVQRRIYSTRL